MIQTPSSNISSTSSSYSSESTGHGMNESNNNLNDGDGKKSWNSNDNKHSIPSSSSSSSYPNKEKGGGGGGGKQEYNSSAHRTISRSNIQDDDGPTRMASIEPLTSNHGLHGTTTVATTNMDDKSTFHYHHLKISSSESKIESSHNIKLQQSTMNDYDGVEKQPPSTTPQTASSSPNFSQPPAWMQQNGSNQIKTTPSNPVPQKQHPTSSDTTSSTSTSPSSTTATTTTTTTTTTTNATNKTGLLGGASRIKSFASKSSTSESLQSVLEEEDNISYYEEDLKDDDNADHRGAIEEDHSSTGECTTEGFDDSMTEIGSVHTENPRVIAIGIVKSTTETSSSSSPPTSDRSPPTVSGGHTNGSTQKDEELSEAVAKDIAKEEHEQKVRINMGTTNARRRSAPPSMLGRRISLEKRSKASTDGVNSSESKTRGTIRASISGPLMGPRTRGRGSTTLGPSKSFLESLKEDILPTVEEPAAPVMRTNSFKNTSEEDHTKIEDSSLSVEDDASVMTNSSRAPRLRGRKSSSGSGLNEADREAKMRTVRGVLGGATRRQRPGRSQSGTPQPVQPTRKMSAKMSVEEKQEAERVNDQEDDLEDEADDATVRTFQSMQSTRSLSSTSSGIDLDEKTRERIIARSAFLRARQPIRSLRESESGVASVASISEMSEDDRKMSASESKAASVSSASSTSSHFRPSDDKRTMRISTGVVPQAASIAASNTDAGRESRPGGEKAAYRRPASESIEIRPPVTTRFSHVSEGTSSVDESLPFGAVTTSDIDEEDLHNEDIEAQAGVPVISPGAFAMGGRNGDGGYDSGYEENEGLVEDYEVVEDMEQHPSSVIRSDSINDSVVATTPLQAELYEEENFVAAEVLIEEEEPDEKIFRRSYLIRFLCAFFSVLVIAGVVIGVVLPRATKQNEASGPDAENNGPPVVEGWTRVGQTLMGPTERDNIHFGNSVAMSADGARMAVGLPGASDKIDENRKNIGAVKIYDLVNGTTWEELTEIPGLFPGAFSGTNIALSEDGSRVAIGAPFSNSDDSSGYVAIYEGFNDTWTLVGDIISDNNNTGEAFGGSIGFSDDGLTVAIGGRYSDNNGVEDAGVVRIFTENNDTWVQLGDDMFGSTLGQQFGRAVALSGDGNRVAVSSLGIDGGNVQTFDFDGSSWVKVGSSLQGESAGEVFGASIAFSQDGSILATGATGYSRGGEKPGVGIVRPYQFDPVSQEWLPFGQPIEGENQLDSFGRSIALSSGGDIMAVGASDNQNFCDNCGHLQVFQKEDDVWNRIGSELGTNETDGGQLGLAIAMSSDGSRVVGGAPSSKYNGFRTNVGHVFVFESTIEIDIDGL